MSRWIAVCCKHIIHRESTTIVQPSLSSQHMCPHTVVGAWWKTQQSLLLCLNRPPRRIWQQILLLSNWQLPIFNTLFVEVHLAFTIYEGRWLSSSSVHWWLWRLRTSLEERRSPLHASSAPREEAFLPTDETHSAESLSEFSRARHWLLSNP